MFPHESRTLKSQLTCLASCPNPRVIIYLTCITFRSIGESTSDLDLSDAGSVTSSSDSEDESDDDGIPFVNGNASVSSSSSALPISALAVAALDAQAEKEFQAEVHASLARAFAEGHSVDNAAVELKTLRMSTNVPLRRVREAVVAGIVELIPLVSNAVEQRKEIARVINRWGALINRIGGVDPVETTAVLQVRVSIHSFYSLFTYFRRTLAYALFTRIFRHYAYRSTVRSRPG